MGFVSVGAQGFRLLGFCRPIDTAMQVAELPGKGGSKHRGFSQRTLRKLGATLTVEQTGKRKNNRANEPQIAVMGLNRSHFLDPHRGYSPGMA